MYRRGIYYQPRRKLASLRQDVVLISVAALFAGVGINVIPQVTSAWQSSRHNSSRQANVSHREAKTKTKATATSATTAATSVGTAAIPAVSSALNTAGNTMTSISDLMNLSKKEVAMRLVSSAENSSTNWRAQFGYIEDIGDGRGFTAGIIGFCSGTGDMLELVQYYTQLKPNNVLAPYLAALKQVNGTDSHVGLGPTFATAWKAAAADPVFQQAQEHERDRTYFNPAVAQAKSDGLRALGQFIYYDAMVMHGPGDDSSSFGGMRASVVQKVKPPSQGGNEAAYLSAFLDARKKLMLTEAAHDDTSRVDTEQRAFLSANNLDLNAPLTWKTYGDSYSIPTMP